MCSKAVILELLVDSAIFVVGKVVSISQHTGGGSLWCFFASSSWVVPSTF